MSVKDVHVDAPMTDYFGALKLGASGADALAPRKKVKKRSDLYKYVQKGDVLRAVNDLVADKTESNWLELATGQDSYLCLKHAFHARVSDDDRENADSQTEIEQGQIEPIVMVLALNREREAAALAQNGSVPHADRIARWDADETSIERDIMAGLLSSMRGTGGMFPPNTMIVPWAVAMAMGGSAELREFMVHVFTEVVKTGVLPPTWRGLNITVPTVMGNVAGKGKSDVFAEIWGDDVLIGFCAPQPFGFATTFTWHFRVNRMRNDMIHCDIFEPEDSRDARITNVNALYRIDNCLTDVEEEE